MMIPLPIADGTTIRQTGETFSLVTPVADASLSIHVQSLVSGDLSAGVNDNVTVGAYITFSGLSSSGATITFNNRANVIVDGHLENHDGINFENGFWTSDGSGNMDATAMLTFLVPAPTVGGSAATKAYVDGKYKPAFYHG